MRSLLPWLGGALVVAVVAHSCQSDAELEYQQYYSYGRTLYNTHCQNCHGAAGEGLKNLIPPLTDTGYLQKQKPKLAAIIKYGASGKIRVSGRTFDNEMPAESHLSEIEIAEIVTYITNSFGNKQGAYLVHDARRDLRAGVGYRNK